VPNPTTTAQSLINIVLNITTLWAAVCIGISLPIFIYRWGSPYEPEYVGRSYKAYLLMAAFQCIRIVSGILHSIIGYSMLKIMILSVLQLINICIVLRFGFLSIASRKFYLMMASCAVKVILHAILVFEASQDSLRPDL
jgi:hypothetical protein